MSRKLAALTAVLSILVFASVSLAYDEFEHRIHKQQQSIERGVARGQLTHREAEILQGNLDHIRRAYGRMRADGTLDRREAGRLSHMLDENQSMIFEKKHNREVRRLY